MKRIEKWVRVAGLGSALLLVASIAGAQEVKESKSNDGYGYLFSDDPLNAGSFGETAARIAVRCIPARVTLIRPRTSFVPELLKAVQHM
jgi:hypothetical protein